MALAGKKWKKPVDSDEKTEIPQINEERPEAITLKEF